MFMSVLGREFATDVETVVAACWTLGEDAGVAVALGHGVLGFDVSDLRFSMTRYALNGPGVLGSVAVVLPSGGWALRMDEVAFPVGATAHRHTHSGSGWRHLVAGQLRVEADHDTTIMDVGDSWFEPAHSPVRAVATQSSGDTRFVRCMVIPLADVGCSTFKLADDRDADLPRLQMTHRHIDHIVQDEAG